MMPWVLRDSERLRLERTGVEELSRSAEWLIGTEWRLDGEFCLDAVIRAHGHDYEVRVSFPALYPDAPAVVRMRNMQQRISSHQYGGADGPLCLEWGPDNWLRDITAVQMLESAYRLFYKENPLGVGRPDVPVVAPSRHKLTIGQELRREWARWYASKGLANYFVGQPKPSIGSFKFSFRQTGEKKWVSLINEIMPLGGSVWRDNQIPMDLLGVGSPNLYVGVWFKTDIDGSTIGRPDTLAELQALLVSMDGGKFLATDGTSPIDGFQQPIAGVLIVDGAGGLHLFIVLSGSTIIACSKVQSEAVSALQSRSPDWDVLNDKLIGIVGLGSAGSKIAVSLARMGVRKFYLVDHDILLPENLLRHALDWQGVVQHKVDAMTEAIGRVAPGSQVDVCRFHITGQESNAVVSGTLDRLAACDLLIDATANPQVFNLMAAISRTAVRPLIWMEVFGGGMGGLVARSRPGIDPTPQDMRNAYLQYCTDNPDPAQRPVVGNYVIESEDGEVLEASDADIAIISHHAVRFVTDCLIPPERSKFPNSMYLIGLAKGWVFEAPYSTIPISMASYAVAGWNNSETVELDPKATEFLLGLIQKNNNAASNTTGN